MSDRVITEICWEPSQGFDVRSSLTFSDATKIRLDPDDYRFKLKLQSNTRYPTDADLHVRTKTFNPEAVRLLEIIQINGTIPKDENGDSTGSIQARLYDGTNEMWWNGAAWAIAGASDWNTEAEINQNLATFDVKTTRQFGVVLNLVTADNRFTPTVESVYVLWQGEVDWIDDILTDSLVGMLQDELSWPVDTALPPLPIASASIDLTEYTDESGLTFKGADSVYDHTNDPNHLNNLLTSFNPTTQILTLSSSIPLGAVPFLRMRAGVNVAWDTHQDYEEVAKLPQVVLRDTENVRSSPYPHWASTGIVRKDTGTGFEIPAPFRATYLITMEVRTDRTREQQRVQEEILRVLHAGPSTEEGPFLRSKATDRLFRLWVVDEFRTLSAKTDFEAAGVRTHELEFRIEDVALQLKPAVAAFAINNLNLNFSAIQSTDEQLATQQGAPVPTTTPETIVVT